MPQIDVYEQFSDAQTVTTTAVSTNWIDLVSQNTYAQAQFDFGTYTNPQYLVVKVNTAFTGGTSIQASLISSDNTDLTTGRVTHLTGPVVPLASLTLGAPIFTTRIDLNPTVRLKSYVGILYTVVGTMTAGRVDAFLSEAVPSWVAYKELAIRA